MCQHLQTVTNTFIIKSRRADSHLLHKSDLKSFKPINYLWINVPPRCTKSLCVNVFWPVWEWGPRNLPDISYLNTSYAQGLSTRDSVKRRRIIESPWYQQNWGSNFQLTTDQNQKMRFENDQTGHMIATSIHGLGTGEGGDRIIIDDAHNINEVESDVKRESVPDIWDNSMSTRLNDEECGAFIGIMQRSHPKDLSDHVIRKANFGELTNWAYLCLPARYEKQHPFPSDTPLPFKDPRTKEGEPLDKNRW